VCIIMHPVGVYRPIGGGFWFAPERAVAWKLPQPVLNDFEEAAARSNFARMPIHSVSPDRLSRAHSPELVLCEYLADNLIGLAALGYPGKPATSLGAFLECCITKEFPARKGQIH
jgi:hypothetical protein